MPAFIRSQAALPSRNPLCIKGFFFPGFFTKFASCDTIPEAVCPILISLWCNKTERWTLILFFHFFLFVKCCPLLNIDKLGRIKLFRIISRNSFIVSNHIIRLCESLSICVECLILVNESIGVGWAEPLSAAFAGLSSGVPMSLFDRLSGVSVSAKKLNFGNYFPGGCLRRSWHLNGGNTAIVYRRGAVSPPRARLLPGVVPPPVPLRFVREPVHILCARRPAVAGLRCHLRATRPTSPFSASIGRNSTGSPGAYRRTGVSPPAPPRTYAPAPSSAGSVLRRVRLLHQPVVPVLRVRIDSTPYSADTASQSACGRSLRRLPVRPGLPPHPPPSAPRRTPPSPAPGLRAGCFPPSTPPAAPPPLRLPSPRWDEASAVPRASGSSG